MYNLHDNATFFPNFSVDVEILLNYFVSFSSKPTTDTSA